MPAPLTGSPTVTTPYSLTTLGCRNCPMMAASWRNLTLSISEAIGCRVLTATSIDSTLVVHTPMLTVPNWPEPRCLIILQCVHCISRYLMDLTIHFKLLVGTANISRKCEKKNINILYKIIIWSSSELITGLTVFSVSRSPCTCVWTAGHRGPFYWRQVASNYPLVGRTHPSLNCPRISVFINIYVREGII